MRACSPVIFPFLSLSIFLNISAYLEMSDSENFGHLTASASVESSQLFIRHVASAKFIFGAGILDLTDNA